MGGDDLVKAGLGLKTQDIGAGGFKIRRPEGHDFGYGFIALPGDEVNSLPTRDAGGAPISSATVAQSLGTDMADLRLPLPAAPRVRLCMWPRLAPRSRRGAEGCAPSAPSRDIWV